MKNFMEYVGKHKFRDNLLFTRWFIRRWGDEFKDDRDSMNLKPSNILTLHSNNSHISIPSLFHQKRMLYEGWFYVYIYNVQRSEDRKPEGRVHTCRQPCAHGRRSFFRHSTTGCTDARQRMWHTGRKECDCKRGKCIIIQSDCINMQNWPHENRVYVRNFSFGWK